MLKTGDRYPCFHKISHHADRGVVGEHDLPSQPVGEQHLEGRQYLKLERVWQGTELEHGFRRPEVCLTCIKGIRYDGRVR